MSKLTIIKSGVSATSSGAAVGFPLPTDSAGGTPSRITVTATSAGHFKLGDSTVTATLDDLLVQPGDRVLLNSSGALWGSFISAAGNATVKVDAVEFGGRYGQPSLDLRFAEQGKIGPAVTFARASNATWFDSSGTLVTMSSNEPRFDYDPVTLQPKGLLIEEQRTNSIRNNTMQGAAVGTPGTLPTYWPAIGTGTGITPEVVGVGVEGGISYIDFRFTGTALGNNFVVTAEGPLVIAASNGQSWSGSWFMKIVSASAPPLTYVNRIRLNDSSGAGLGQIDTLFTPTTTLSRYVSAGTISIAGTAYVQPQIRFGMTIGSSYDFTVRIGMPQIEQGAFATSVISTSGTAATRAADVASMTGTNFSSWYRQDEGTIFVEFMRSGDGIVAGGGGATPRVVNVDDGINSYQIRFNSTSTIEATSSAGIYIARAWYADAINKSALAYKADDSSFVVNASVASDATGSAAASMTNIKFGAATSGVSGFLNGHIRRIAYFPRRLSNDELQAITA